MQSILPDPLEDKENPLQAHKPRLSNATARAFGTDLTKSIPPPLPLSSANPFILDYYASEIFSNLFETEQVYIAKHGYMKNQADITEKMRAILIDWLVEVHYKFRLCPETLFLTVNIIDRYLERIPISKNRLQLVGVAAMLVASKYEDIYPPETRDFVYITDKAFNKEDVLAMEGSILKQLNYNLTLPSAYRFLERFAKLDNSTDPQFCLARYFIELTLIDYKMLRYRNSLIAASAIYLMHKIKGIKPEWGAALSSCSPYKEEDLKQCAKEMCMLFQQAQKSNLNSVKNKFMNAVFFHVANTPLI